MNLKETIDKNKNRPDAKANLKSVLAKPRLEDLQTAFDLIICADREAADIGPPFGIGKYEQRYLYSLRDQGKPLSKKQLLSLRSVVLSEPYISQLALLWNFSS